LRAAKDGLRNGKFRDFLPGEARQGVSAHAAFVSRLAVAPLLAAARPLTPRWSSQTSESSTRKQWAVRSLEAATRTTDFGSRVTTCALELAALSGARAIPAVLAPPRRLEGVSSRR
jgi:hypothetical protein